MRYFLLAAGVLVSASSLEDSCHSTPSHLESASSGTNLLQRPSVQFSHVDFDDLGHDKLLRQSTIPEHSTSQINGTYAGLTELRLPLEHETFSMLLSGEWSRWTPHHSFKKHPHGVHAFLSSVVFFDWCLFASAVMLFLILHMLVLGRMAENGCHLAVLGIWVAIGLAYNAVIWARFGSNAGASWFVGYLLEFIFLVENIFIFHIVIAAFKTPIKLTTKALHIVVWGQIAFEMIFFMGLAAWLRSFKVLPYLLGVWLICCGFLAARGDPSMEVEDVMETSACRAFTSCLGDRLSPTYEKDGECLLHDSSGKMRVSLLGLVVFVLLLADFLLEIDVVLTKIEELPNHYIAFTSSALAAFSIPELFFVSKGLLKRFKMLKYGIGFVLVLFGAQMLMASVYIIRPIVACTIIVGVLVTCVILSLLQNLWTSRQPDLGGDAGAALAEVGQGDAEDTDYGTGDIGANPTEASETDSSEPQKTERL